MKRLKALSALMFACVAFIVPATAMAADSYSIQDYPKDAYLTKSDMSSAADFVYDGSVEATDSSGELTSSSRQVPERLQQLQNLYKITFRGGYLYTLRYVGSKPATSTEQTVYNNEVLYVYDKDGKIISPTELTGTVSDDGIDLWLPMEEATSTTYYFGCSSKATVDATTKESHNVGPYTFMTREQSGGFVYFDTQKEGMKIAPQLLTTGPSYATAPETPTAADATFAGWYKEPECINEWKFNEDEVTGPTTLYAKWSSNPVYNITFNTQLAGVSVEATSVNTIPAYIPKPADPVASKEQGVGFGGWFKEPTCMTAWKFESDVATSDVTLYAKWIPKTYTISYELNGGVAAKNAPTTYVFDTETNLPEPTREGYTFTGWYDNKDFNGTPVETLAKGTEGNQTFYAQWRVNKYPVLFASNGGSVVSSQTVEYQGLATAPAVPTRSGYIFAGWYKDSGLTTPWDFTKERITGDTTLYAKWGSLYKVTFDSRGGSSRAAQSIVAGGYVKTVSSPTRSGYKFGGWYTSTSYTTKWDFSKNIITKNTVLYAKWISTNSYLSKISKNHGSWDKYLHFKKSGGIMRINVSRSTSSLTLTPVRASSKAKVYTKVSNGKYHKLSKVTIRIKRGSLRTIKYKVVAESGATRYYTVYITRK